VKSRYSKKPYIQGARAPTIILRVGEGGKREQRAGATANAQR